MPFILVMCSSRVEIKTPQGQALSVTGNTDGVPSSTTENENQKLVAVQGEEVHPHNESFSKTIDMT